MCHPIFGISGKEQHGSVKIIWGSHRDGGRAGGATCQWAIISGVLGGRIQPDSLGVALGNPMVCRGLVGSHSQQLPDYLHPHPILGSTHKTGNVPLTFPEGYNSLQNKCRTADIDRQNLGRSGKFSFFIIYKFWQNCASVRQVSDLILKTVIIRLADNMLAYNVLLAFPERYDTTSSYSTSIGLWKFNSTGLILQ